MKRRLLFDLLFCAFVSADGSLFTPVLLLHQIGNGFADKELSALREMQAVLADHLFDKTAILQALLPQIDYANRKLARNLFYKQRIHLLITVDLMHIAQPMHDVLCVEPIADKKAKIPLRVDRRQRHEHRTNASRKERTHHAADGFLICFRRRCRLMLLLRAL